MEVLKLFYIVLVIFLVSYGIVKRYYPQGVLLLGGAVFFIGAWLFADTSSTIMSELKNSSSTTGVYFLDIYYHLERLFSYRLGGIGLTVMAIGGYSFFLSYTGASNELIFYSTKPVSKIKSPYVLLGLFYMIGAFLSLFITSAASLGLFCMFTFYPILISVGVSPLAAVGMIITTECMDVGVLSVNTLRAAEVASINAASYFTDHQLPVFLPTVLMVAIAHMLWQKRMDQKAGHDYRLHRIDADKITRKAPGIYALLPIIPFLLILIFANAHSIIKINIIIAMFVSLSIGLCCEMLRYRSFSKFMQGLEVYFKGMVSVFPVVTLIVCAGFFADGLIAIGVIDYLFVFVQQAGVNTTVVTVVIAVFLAFLAALIGSGNAAFFPMANLTPALSAKLGMSALDMILPLNFVVGIGRSVSPIAAVVIACCDIAQVSPTDAIKRSAVPMAVAFAAVVVLSFVFA